MEWFRYATSVYGQDQLLGANWDLIWWFGGAALAVIAADALLRLVVRRKKTDAPAATAGGRVTRHHLVDRVYHWLLALCVLTLLVTAFAPILGWKFEWVEPHWIAGVILSLLVVYHIVRAVIWQDIWAMIVVPADIRSAFARSAAATAKIGKYALLQKLYHWLIAVLVLALMGTGLTMWLKIDTPFWKRNPYILSDDIWGLVYTVHDLCAMAVLTIVAVHIYLGLRPDKWWQNRSMFTGTIARDDYIAHHDTARWKPHDA